MKYRFDHTEFPFPLDLCGDSVGGAAGPKPPTLPWREQILFVMRHRLGGTPFAVNHSLYGYYDRFWKEADAKPGPEFHPEFFAQGYPGRPPQMCYTNPRLVRQVVQDARDYFDGKGAKTGAVTMGDSFAVTPMDGLGFCKCPNCVALIKPATRGKGLFSNDGISNYIFAFVNEVAREIKKSHPQKCIASSAYASYAYPPTTVKLESNIWINLCLQPRNSYIPGVPENDLAVLNAWVAESKGPKLLWLYYCFPSLSAINGAWAAGSKPFPCFPGFFAHTIVNQMQVYREAGIYGMSYEPSYLAYNQRSALLDQLEFYVTWKLADDPSLDGNALIDEFFNRYYGSAAKPMKAFYELVEQTYANLASYPPGFADHQTEEVAWKYLGTQSRMEQLGRLMDEARATAKTEVEKRRVALFDKGIWQSMQAGRKAFLERIGQPANK